MRYTLFALLCLVAPLVAQEAPPAAATVPVVRVNSLADWQTLLGAMSQSGMEQVLFEPSEEGIQALLQHRQALVAGHLIRAYQVREYKNYGLLELEYMGDAERLRALAKNPDAAACCDDAVLQAAQRIIAENTTPEMTPRERAKALHDAVVKLCSYDDEAAAVAARQDAQAALLPPHHTTCEGYSMAYLLLCRMCGIPCLWVGGEAMPSSGKWEPHGWNLIQLDGAWYHVDTTFDDPKLPDGQTACEDLYFAKTDEEMAPNHHWDRAVYPATPTTPLP